VISIRSLTLHDIFGSNTLGLLPNLTLFASRVPAYKHLANKIQQLPEFASWLQQGTPEQCVPILWDEEKDLTAVGIAMHQLLVIQVCIDFYDPIDRKWTLAR